MGTKPRNELKDDTVPTLFQHSQCSSRKRISSIERASKRTKVQAVEETLQDYDNEAANSKREVGCSTIDLKSVKEVGVQNSAKTKSVRTQYREKDYLECEDEILTNVERKERLAVKIKKVKKCRDVAVNTDLTFKPHEEIKHSNYPNHEPIRDTDEEEHTTEVEDSDDDSYHALSDSLDESDEGMQSVDLKLQTKLIVFWSCLVPLLKVCQFCYQPAKICKIFYKGTKIIVDVMCEMKHNFSWHSQPNENGIAAGNISLIASIILSGGTFERFSEMFKTADISFFSHRHFT